MNPFTILSEVQSAYLTYVHTFQKFENPAIQDWVAEREKSRWEALLLEAEVIAANLKESGTRR